MCLNGLRCSQNAGKLHSESTKFRTFFHVQLIFIHAALVSSPALIIPSHNKKMYIRLLSLLLFIFRPQCN